MKILLFLLLSGALLPAQQNTFPPNATGGSGCTPTTGTICENALQGNLYMLGLLLEGPGDGIHGYTSIPAGLLAGQLGGFLDTGINIFGNLLTTLPAGFFDFPSKAMLTSINLANNKITSLPSTIFSGLTGVVYIGLDSNPFVTLPAGLFTDLAGLDSLTLNNESSLTSIPSGLFVGTTLTAANSNVNLSNTPLTTIPAGTFNSTTGINALLLSSDALDAAGVNEALYDLTVCCLANAGNVDTSGGTNAAPTTGPPNGIAAAAALTGAGWTVVTN